LLPIHTWDEIANHIAGKARHPADIEHITKPGSQIKGKIKVEASN
jgi:hypothetical protein